jgi:uncharacterized protein YjbI with pentapeptide repeats
MRLLSPPTLGFAPLPSRVDYPAHSVTLLAKALLKLRHGQAAEIVQSASPPFPTGDIPYPDDEAGVGAPRYESDCAPFKPGADALLVGHFHAPQGRAVKVSEASFTVGARSLRVAVIGRRVWDGRRWPELEGAQPFTSLELRWEYAFGGAGLEANPIGRGYGRGPMELPRIERPERPLTGAGEPPEPIGFGPLRREWWLRRALLGTFDERWRATRWPWFPEDFDWRHFHAAVPELRFRDYLVGDEALRMKNLHPTIPEYETRLPGVRAVAAVQRIGEGGLRTEVVAMRLDTLWVDMDAEAAVLVWRGHCQTRDADMSDLAHAWVDLEPLAAAAPEAAIARAAEAAIRADEAQWEMTPERPPPVISHSQAPAPPTEEEGPPPELAEGLARVAALQKPEPPPALAAEQQAHLDRIMAEARAKLERELGREEPSPAAPRWTRERVREVLAGGGSLAGEQLGAIDLSGEDLSGANLASAVLAGARLAGAKLLRANLARASLERAELSGVEMSSANLEGADLSRSSGKDLRAIGANLKGANLAGVGWPGAQLAGANLELVHGRGAALDGADLSDATLIEADLEGARLAGADVTGAKGGGASFVGAALGRARFDEAVLAEADFTGADLSDGSFERADLTDATLENATAPRLGLAGAIITKLRAAEAELTGATLQGANGEAPYFEGARLNGARLAECRLSGADFSRCDLREARFLGCTLKGAKFGLADLREAQLLGCDCFEAVFEGARMEECDGSESSFYGAEFLDAEVGRFRGKNRNLVKTKLAVGDR